MEKIIWSNLKELIPYENTPLLVDTLHGRSRKAIFTQKGFFYTDCTHPMQNSHLSELAILRWRYQDKNIRGGYLNKYEKQKEGEGILSGAFKNTFLCRVKNQLIQWKTQIISGRTK